MTAIAIADIPTLSWAAYASAIRQEPKSHLQERLDILASARYLLQQVESFGQLDDRERKSLAGFIGRNQCRIDDVNEPWHIFGSMKGAGCFKNRVNANDPHLAAALDQIPLEGQVTATHYDRYVTDFTKAFDGMKKSAGISTASRLLAMKRPDYFICVTRKNRPRLAEIAGLGTGRLTIATYWTRLIEPTTTTPWWQSPRPTTDDTASLWHGRTALLDVLCHVE